MLGCGEMQKTYQWMIVCIIVKWRVTPERAVMVGVVFHSGPGMPAVLALSRQGDESTISPKCFHFQQLKVIIHRQGMWCRPKILTRFSTKQPLDSMSKKSWTHNSQKPVPAAHLSSNVNVKYAEIIDVCNKCLISEKTHSVHLYATYLDVANFLGPSKLIQ